jgi:SPP1 family predicted phage head-tail adaptor
MNWPSINPGLLRHQIQIEAQTTATDGAGQRQDVWTVAFGAYAAIDALSWKELFQAGQDTSQVTHIVTLRWTNDPIFPGMQVIFGARRFRIQSVENVQELNVLVKLLCLELNPQSTGTPQ